jgi:hypothetical protein
MARRVPVRRAGGGVGSGWSPWTMPSIPASGSVAQCSSCVPLCTTHNLLKERGFRVDRDDKGNLHTIDPHGTEIT